MKFENLNLKLFQNTTDVFITANNTEKNGGKNNTAILWERRRSTGGEYCERNKPMFYNLFLILFTNNYTSTALPYKCNII